MEQEQGTDDVRVNLANAVDLSESEEEEEMEDIIDDFSVNVNMDTVGPFIFMFTFFVLISFYLFSGRRRNTARATLFLPISRPSPRIRDKLQCRCQR